jgi:hypothetical protein
MISADAGGHAANMANASPPTMLTLSGRALFNDFIGATRRFFAPWSETTAVPRRWFERFAEEDAMGMDARQNSEQLSCAIGEAVVRIWGHLPHDVQQHLFEEIITHQDERMRPQLAVLLHDKHPRTADGIKARAMPEPDSLGG